MVDMERFFELVVFNYIYANGDAHLKNFSLILNGQDYRLAPAYDLLNTSLHVNGDDLQQVHLPARWRNKTHCPKLPPRQSETQLHPYRKRANHPLHQRIGVIIVEIQDKLIFAGFVRASVCRKKLKLLYPFDNRIIIAKFALSHCCRFGKRGL